MRDKNSFTLIELLIVVAVIALLATIASAFWGTARERTRDNRRKADLRQIVFAMKLCYGDQNCGSDSAYCKTGGGANAVLKIGGPGKCNSAGGTTYAVINGDPLNRGNHQYTWIDNTNDDQRFCVYTQSELTNKWFAASNKGLCFTLSAAPSRLDCWTTCP